MIGGYASMFFAAFWIPYGIMALTRNKEVIEANVFLYACVVLLTVLAVPTIVFNILMLVGVHKNIPSYILAYLIYTLINIVSVTIVLIAQFTGIIVWEFVWKLLVVDICTAVFWLGVARYYRQMSEDVEQTSD